MSRTVPRTVWRTACKPQWLALLVVVLVLATAMASLGQWQLRRAHENGAAAQRAQAARPAVPLSTLLPAQSPFPSAANGRTVTASGTWDVAGQLLVAGRLQGNRNGWWVLTPLRLADGSGIGVVRGWTATVDAPAVSALSTAGAGTGAGRDPVTVTGVLLPGEQAVDRAPGQGSGLPAGQVDRIDPADLVLRWDYPIHTGFVVASRGAPGTAGLSAVTTTTDGGGLALQNLSYAVQWWLFALFGLFLWWRLVRDDAAGRLRRGPAAPPAGPIGDDEAGDPQQRAGTTVEGAAP